MLYGGGLVWLFYIPSLLLSLIYVEVWFCQQAVLFFYTLFIVLPFFLLFHTPLHCWSNRRHQVPEENINRVGDPERVCISIQDLALSNCLHTLLKPQAKQLVRQEHTRSHPSK